MAELYPAPLKNLLLRIATELEAQGSLFDLPRGKFWLGDAGLDLSVRFKGDRAATPLGPAAGPQSQLAQNIVLSWLGGSRIMELKTVQINDRLQIPRPCIWAGNVGYNVEWSQELLLEQSLQEYVTASMILDIMTDMRVMGQAPDWDKADTIFDISLGYDLKGIQTERIRSWVARMKDATAMVDRLRSEIPARFARYRDFRFKTALGTSATLSTFHGCPAGEIERIVEFMLTEMGLNVYIKLNPTLLGYETVKGLLHDHMGYTDILLIPEAFSVDLQFPEALQIVARLRKVAARVGRALGVKLTNTLVARNKADWFAASEASMYVSGPPLHVISMNLLKKLRQHVGPDLPISFSAGIERRNFPGAVAQNLCPITTCTDLLRTGGYQRLSPYLTHLEERMRSLGVRNITDYIVKAGGNGSAAIGSVLSDIRDTLEKEHGPLPAAAGRYLADTAAALERNLASSEVDITRTLQDQLEYLQERGDPMEGGDRAERAIGLLKMLPERVRATAGHMNTPGIVDELTADERYSARKNRAVPRKIGSHLVLYDCISCDKCIPVCPNDANFSYEVTPRVVDCPQIRVESGSIVEGSSHRFEIKGEHQIANYQDFCNDCGNCDVFCPEDGGPYKVKPHFFGTEQSFLRHDDRDGFWVSGTSSQRRMRGRIQGRSYDLSVDPDGIHRFQDGCLSLTFDPGADRPRECKLTGDPPEGHALDLAYFHIMASILEGVTRNSRVNYVNTAMRAAEEAQGTRPGAGPDQAARSSR